jgi:hypothetical protein
MAPEARRRPDTARAVSASAGDRGGHSRWWWRRRGRRIMAARDQERGHEDEGAARKMCESLVHRAAVRQGSARSDQRGARGTTGRGAPSEHRLTDSTAPNQLPPERSCPPAPVESQRIGERLGRFDPEAGCLAIRYRCAAASSCRGTSPPRCLPPNRRGATPSSPRDPPRGRCTAGRSGSPARR